MTQACYVSIALEFFVIIAREAIIVRSYILLLQQGA